MRINFLVPRFFLIRLPHFSSLTHSKLLINACEVGKRGKTFLFVWLFLLCFLFPRRWKYFICKSWIYCICTRRIWNSHLSHGQSIKWLKVRDELESKISMCRKLEKRNSLNLARLILIIQNLKSSAYKSDRKRKFLKLKYRYLTNKSLKEKMPFLIK